MKFLNTWTVVGLFIVYMYKWSALPVIVFLSFSHCKCNSMLSFYIEMRHLLAEFGASVTFHLLFLQLH